MKRCSLLFAAIVMMGACNGQSKSGASPNASNAKHQRLIRTQGTNQYASVFCGLQDQKGNLWFGTMGEGLFRYDGTSFTQFTTASGLCNNYVYSILEDRSGNIWLGTAYGVCRFDGQTFVDVPIIVRSADGYHADILPVNGFKKDLYGTPEPDNIVWSMMQDRSGILWLGASKGMYRYDGHSFMHFPDEVVADNPQHVKLRMVDDMLEDRSGNIWFCSGMLPGNEGICRYDGKAIVQFKPAGEGWVRKVIEDQKGNLYFVTRRNGVCAYDGKDFTNITKAGGIDNEGITTIAVDKSGVMWVGTELGSGQKGEPGGLWRYDGRAFTRFTTAEGLVHNGIFCIVPEKNGKIWLGTRNVGLSRYDGKSFETFSE